MPSKFSRCEKGLLTRGPRGRRFGFGQLFLGEEIERGDQSVDEVGDVDGDMRQAGGGEIEDRREKIFDLNARVILAHFGVVPVLARDLNTQKPESGTAQ